MLLTCWHQGHSFHWWSTSQQSLALRILIPQRLTWFHRAWASLSNVCSVWSVRIQCSLSCIDFCINHNFIQDCIKFIMRTKLHIAWLHCTHTLLSSCSLTLCQRWVVQFSLGTGCIELPCSVGTSFEVLNQSMGIVATLSHGVHSAYCLSTRKVIIITTIMRWTLATTAPSLHGGTQSLGLIVPSISSEKSKKKWSRRD